jgi:hypothetical protein
VTHFKFLLGLSRENDESKYTGTSCIIYSSNSSEIS